MQQGNNGRNTRIREGLHVFFRHALEEDVVRAQQEYIKCCEHYLDLINQRKSLPVSEAKTFLKRLIEKMDAYGYAIHQFLINNENLFSNSRSDYVQNLKKIQFLVRGVPDYFEDRDNHTDILNLLSEHSPYYNIALSHGTLKLLISRIKSMNTDRIENDRPYDSWSSHKYIHVTFTPQYSNLRQLKPHDYIKLLIQERRERMKRQSS